jgi:Cysteine dioxygenase type I
MLLVPFHSRPADRDLSRQELRELALGIADRPAVWRHLVRHDPEARVYEELLRDDHVAVWLICWMRDHDTGFHDHDRSAGGVAVASGEVREDRLSLGGSVTRLFRAGQAFDFASSDIHRVLHSGASPSVTIHAYSPPLSRMGAYETTPSGELQRHSIAYNEELRPRGLVA